MMRRERRVVLDADGNEIDAVICPDGGRVRVMDGSSAFSSEMRRAFARVRDDDADDDADDDGAPDYAQDAADAYEARSARLRDAWRKPAQPHHDDDEDDIAERVARALSEESEEDALDALRDAAKTAHEAKVRRLTNAWRNR